MSERPEWLGEECPAWCSGDHAGQEMRSCRAGDAGGSAASDALIQVPVIVLNRRSRGEGGELLRVVEATELDVELHRFVGDTETWVGVGDDQQHLDVTVESARRLHDVLGRLLALGRNEFAPIPSASG